MEDLRTIAYAIRPTADFLHDYCLCCKLFENVW